jgi:hypothetical protein
VSSKRSRRYVSSFLKDRHAKSATIRQTERGLQSINRELQNWLEVRRLSPSLNRLRPLTMVSDLALIDLVHALRTVLDEGVPGDLVECGVWRGGAAFLLASQLKQAGVSDRQVWLFDSFEGLPDPQEIDGEAALAYSRDTEGAGYYDNCRASLEEVRANAEELGLGALTKFVKGWFSDTLPVTSASIGPIAILRIDADWYSSVRDCLDHLYDHVSEGGFVIIDDYFAWDGCVVAVHEFLSSRQLPHRIETTPGGQAFFRKQLSKTTALMPEPT